MGQPNGPIVLDEIWSPAQWNAAWASVTSDIAAAIAPLAPLASPALTGNPTAPTASPGDNDTSIATTAFVAAAVTAGTSTFAPLASPTLTGDPKAPTATPGDNDTSIATTAFVAAAVTAGTSTFAPLASPTLTGDPKAPTATPGDNDTSIATTAFVTAAVAAVASSAGLTNVGRNKLHNATFNIAQRGLPITTAAYTLDRWILQLTSDTVSVSQSALADADRTAIGDEEALFALANVFTGNAAAGAFSLIQQRIETVRRLSGKTVSVSFWAKAASGTPKLGVSLDQNFGSGGSTTVTGSGTAVTLSTTWTRYSVAGIALASASGKTVGAGDYTALNLWYSSGTTNATRSGTVGVQSGTVSIWGVQVEIASAATLFEKIDPSIDFRNCLRFFELIAGVSTFYADAANPFNISFAIQPKRASPTAGISLSGGANYSTATIGSTNNHTVSAVITPTGLGEVAYSYTVTASADL